MAADAAVNFNLLHRTCKLVVLLCFLHISVTIVFYIRSLDLRFAYAQKQQTYNRSTNPRPAITSGVEAQESQEPLKGRTHKKVEAAPPKKLEKCPETSPLLGKSTGSGLLAFGWTCRGLGDPAGSPGGGSPG